MVALTKVVVFQFADKNALNAALERPCSFYEGSKMRHGMLGVNFPRGTYMQWLEAVHKHSLSAIEQRVSKIVREDRSIRYVVGYVAGDASTRLHEMAHAFYALDEGYQKRVEALWSSLPDNLCTLLRKEMLARGYTEDHCVDEFQAYVLESPKGFGKKATPFLVNVHRELKAMFDSLDSQSISVQDIKID